MKCFLTLIITALLGGCLTLTALGQEKWKLRPLAYNHPGLEVDLGVGLWAWPMPLDYDGDGDFDLLVACPDKPSNGVYYFDNPSQDPKVKTPVFKPAVRLGPCTHNFQLSYVKEKPRILKPGFEYVDFQSRGFQKPKKIYLRTNIHRNGVRANMWRYADYEGDGDHDLIVGAGDWTDYGWDHAYDSQGRWRNGPLHGYIYLIENHGSDEAPNYSSTPKKLRAAGSEIDVYGWPSPNLADFDGDGDLDLLCGEFLDGFTYFENQGTRQKPVYSAGKKLKEENGNRLVMDLQMITPTAIDWDRDGDIDLIVGDEDGRVALVENTGTLRDQAPVFREPLYLKQEASTLKFGALATPFAYDWDADGDQDILCGNTAGYIGFFENLEKGEKWAGPVLLEVNGEPYRIMAGPSGSIQGPCEAKWGYTTLSAGHWNGASSPRIVVNNIWGKLQLFEKQKDAAETHLRSLPFPKLWDEPPPKWSWWSGGDDSISQWRTTPVISDFDGDDRAELVLLDQEGYLTIRNPQHKNRRIFVDENLQPIRLNNRSCGRSGRIKLAVADWDGDGRKDILTNSENATWWRNCKDTDDGRVILKRIGNLAKRNVAGHTSSPAICDFDKDGKPDLLVGAENGRIYHIRHEDCVAYPAEKLKTGPPKKIAPPRFPGLVREEFVFTKAKFPQCHASTICETSRGLVCAWFGGTKEKNKDVGIWASYHDGGAWSAPKEWANGIQHDDLRYPCWNPVLFQPPGDAPTLLFFKAGPDPRTWWGEMMISYDRGRTFRERRRLPGGIDGPVRCKPLLLSSGTLLCGSSTEYDGWRVHFEKVQLVDGVPAGTWKRIGPINEKEEFNAIQPTFLRHNDGTLQVLCRTQEKVITTSFSEDQGATWSKLEATTLPNPNSGIEAVTLRDGRHLLVYNHLGSGQSGWGRRGLLNLATSKDGKSWNKVAVLEREEKAEFSYPAIIQTEDGFVHITYTWKRQRIKHVVVDPAKISIGETLGTGSWGDD